MGYPAEGDQPEKLLFSAPDIELRRLDCAALIGPNGAGKSTFLKTILGFSPRWRVRVSERVCMLAIFAGARGA